MDDHLKRIFNREFGVNPDTNGFIDVSSYLQNVPQEKLKTGKKIENFMKTYIGRCFDFAPDFYDVSDRVGESVGSIAVRESLAPVLYGGEIVGGMYQVEVFNQFSQAVSSVDFLRKPEYWHQKLQAVFSVMSKDSYNGEEIYWGIRSGFLDEDILLDVVSDKQHIYF